MSRAGASPKGAARREQILRTAMRVLASDGYRSTSMRAIGRELGLEPAHMLYYFDSREGLLRAVVEQWDADALAELGGEVSAEEALDFYVRTIRHNAQRPGIVHLYLGLAAEAVHPEHAAHAFVRERFERVRTLLADGIRAEQRAGRIAARVDAESAARDLTALADGLQLQALLDPGVDAPAGVAAAIADLRRP